MPPLKKDQWRLEGADFIPVELELSAGQSGAAQRILLLGCFGSDSTRGGSTTQVPQLGQVTHEPAMRSDISAIIWW